MPTKKTTQQRRQELILAYEDLTDIVRNVIDDLREGKQELRATMLKELLAFLSQSEAALEKLTALEEAEAASKPVPDYKPKEDDPYADLPVFEDPPDVLSDGGSGQALPRRRDMGDPLSG